MSHSKIAIIGIGNRFRSDDAVGIRVTELIKLSASLEVSIYTQIHDESDLIDAWQNIDKTILIDAVCTGNKPGTVFRLIGSDIKKLGEKEFVFRCSTHGFNLMNAIELAKALNTLPSEIIIYGIEAEKIDHGTECSMAIQQIIPIVTNQILDELEKLLNHKRIGRCTRPN